VAPEKKEGSKNNIREMQEQMIRQIVDVKHSVGDKGTRENGRRYGR
jgi:hypothetical protein